MTDAVISIVYSSIPRVSSAYATGTASAAVASSSSVASTYQPFYGQVDSTSQPSFLRSVNAGMYIGAVLLGVHTITLGRALVAASREKRLSHRALFLVVASALWAMALVYEICNIVFTVDAWIIGEGSSGTSYTYFVDNQNSGLEIAATVAALISTLLTDGFLFVRCSALWWSPLVTVLLGLLTLATYAFDILEVYWVATSGNTLWQTPLFGQLSVSVALAQSLHVIFTILLTYRLAAKHSKLVGVTGMAIESALLYSIVSIVFMATYCAPSMAANAFLPMLVQIQGIAIDLIIARWYRRERTQAAEPAVPATIVQLPAPVQAPSDTSSIIDNEKPMLTLMASKWDQELDKEPVPPECTA
ncbi:uncharacterized protein B0H18DRAFT_952457 [Fomitopsis serialis]|uniref:uncharacterized protein n=1 Tax=Fomitopsis serialis TaxID=139415 RepID=UPI00200849C7|nr:uncharacterized protein B0H18DRAFT_952457 [Neoantrodia serialis]KAH9932355.1 hypothetical protein B0H18DRAFT_952457 [Neoantrodia serialis]